MEGSSKSLRARKMRKAACDDAPRKFDRRMKMKSIKDAGMPRAVLSTLRTDFLKNDKHRLAQTVACRTPVHEVCTNYNLINNTAHVFNVRVTPEGKPVTNQRSSGRCWLFACLNCMRVELMKKLNVDELELSQSYLFFWDKVERSFYDLNVYLECARNGEDPTGRLVQHLLKNPTEDGGQWDMITNLVEKYGIIPKNCWTETWSCENSRVMNALLQTKLREYCATIYELVKAGKSDEEIREENMPVMMDELYRIISICVGTPPEQFTFEYYANQQPTGDKATEGEKSSVGTNLKMKTYEKIGPITPLEFYQKYVKPTFNMENMVVVVNDPREGHAFERTYTVDKLNNMHGAPPVRYLNLPIQKLKELSLATLQRQQLVWFGCHVSRCFNWKNGYNALDIYDYKLMLDVEPFNLNKGDRLVFNDSLMTHAMSFTACQVDQADENGEKEKEQASETNGDAAGSTAVTEGYRFHRWRVENSWGHESGNAGYITMTDRWFDEYVYEVAVDKSLLGEELLKVFEEMEPVVLPAWDPMGALARC